MAQVTQAQVTKPAKKAAKKSAVKKAAAPAPKIGYRITNRPSSGVVLFAYTEATLTLLGMYDGAAIPQKVISETMGATALRYHLDKGTFAKNDSGDIVLTQAGKAFFSDRRAKAAPAHIEAFKNMMVTGQMDGVVNKNDLQTIPVTF